MSPERKCNGGPDGPWCGEPAVFVCTEGKVPAVRDWQGLQWFACAKHTGGHATEAIEAFFARLAPS